MLPREKQKKKIQNTIIENDSKRRKNLPKNPAKHELINNKHMKIY